MRRDFTINAMFFNINTRTVEDLTGLVRFTGIAVPWLTPCMKYRDAFRALLRNDTSCFTNPLWHDHVGLVRHETLSYYREGLAPCYRSHSASCPMPHLFRTRTCLHYVCRATRTCARAYSERRSRR